LVAAGVGVAVVLAVALVVVFDRREATPAIGGPDPSVFGGSAARRVPETAVPLWSVDIEHDGDHWVDVVGRDLVVAAHAGAGTDPDTTDITVVALDALTGGQRWTTQFAADHPRDVRIIGTVDGVLVVEHPGELGPTATGIDVATGETRWADDVASSEGYVGLVGTPFLARLSSRSDRFVTLIDAVSGGEVGTIASDPPAADRLAGWSTDRRGNWYVIDDGVLVVHDLRVEPGEPTVVGSVDDASVWRVVVGDRLAVLDSSGSITFEGADASGPATLSDDVPAPVRALTPVSGSNFVVTAPRSIAGVSVEGDDIELAWSLNDGVVVAGHPVEGGALIQVATRGGAAMQLVDGVTGETVEHLTMVPGALQALAVAGDGFVALQSSGLGTKLTGFDLDGTERWSIPDSMPVVVGDRIVVRATSNEVPGDDSSTPPLQALRITAFGDE
jgi:hypothetical protein